ncbi:DMT family transporter [Methanolobus chelungpuianus]|uniref:Multidrug transporter n=1 Tax=Methanolobus chelungpuianus TaxID=502115 RepID=A0AAE3HAU0_9EURY|nr:multidrug efflux SMR transporter [Methanolobus chelungpuianus]MCQ6962890.1 multidrug transporter [Methanolobus chelungpuianus]
MEWVYLIIAGMFETGWAVGMKYSEGMSKLYPTAFMLTCLVISMLLLERSLRVLPIGTGYAVWTGIGIMGTTILGILLFNESANMLRILCIVMIAAGIIGLKVLSVN